MFNILKVAGGLWQSVPHLNNLHDNAQAPYFQTQENTNYMRQNLHQARSPQKDIRQKEEQKKTGAKADDKKAGNNKKNDDNNDNNGGGLLEPIIEDLQGFIKGKRSPALYA